MKCRSGRSLSNGASWGGLEAALLPQRLKLIVFLHHLMRHMGRLGLVGCSGTLLVDGLFLPLFVEHDTLTFVFHGWHSFGRQRGREAGVAYRNRSSRRGFRS